MKWSKEHGNCACRVGGVLLLLAGFLAAYGWHFTLAPWRRTFDPKWVNSHSPLEYWREAQKGIRRCAWSHDDGFTVGMFGDKSWAEWIMRHVKPGTAMDCMGTPCHSATAMRSLSNQDVGEDGDAWLDWWEKNRTKSQEEWIEDGFRQRGLAIDVPPTPEQAPLLLEVLGSSETNKSGAELKYNAFRCLRDSGFEPVAFVLSNRTVSAEIERGLLKYAVFQRRWPAAGGVGILPFGKTEDACDSVALPALLTKTFQGIAYVLVFGPLLLGTGLLAWSFRKKA